MFEESSAGDLAIVLHSHMPYVEGFGTYPFGEEWLFDAVIRSYLPVLEIARGLTMTVTPVLADQLEDAGTKERLRDFLLEWRIGAAEADLKEVPEECRPACEAELARYRRALELLDGAGGDPLRPFQRAAAEGRVALAASAATHAVLPLLATR
jgi:1,4-alpha-glucan branching enzyme